jgi:hypothetical protein
MKAGKAKPSAPAWCIEIAANAVVDAAREAAPSGYDAALAEAQLADTCRDLGTAPLPPPAFAALTAGMDEGDWRRFTVAISLLAPDGLRKPLGTVFCRVPLEEQIKGLVATAQALKAVSIPVLASSMVRAEEMARRLALALGLSIEGEDAAASAQRLAKIDYARLLAKVDAAKASAEEQMAKLFKHQEAEDNRIRRRGKW